MLLTREERTQPPLVILAVRHTQELGRHASYWIRDKVAEGWGDIGPSSPDCYVALQTSNDF